MLVLITAVTCLAGNHYKLIGWRNWGGPENGQDTPGVLANMAGTRIFVMNEDGSPVGKNEVRIWSEGILYGNSFTDGTRLTDDRGIDSDHGFQFFGSPHKLWCTSADGSSSTSDVTPEFWNHDNHRAYDVYFVKTDSSSTWTADTSYCGTLLDMNSCPSTAGFLMNTPLCSTYYSGFRELGPGGMQSFGQTFVAGFDRATIMRAHLSKGAGTIWRWAAQIFEGGPDGPPMGPKKNLKHNYISDDIKYFLSYGTDECALKPGNTYYVKFTAVDGSNVNAYVCTSDVAANGTLYQNDVPVSGRDLQCQVLGISSNNSNVGTVSGTVTNALGQPINEARVTVGTRTLLTGKLGTYKCYNIAPGTYTIAVAAPGYESRSITDRVVAVGGALTTDVVLDKSAGPIRIVSTNGTNINPGDANVPVSMTVTNTSVGDCFVNAATLAFYKGSVNASSYFTVTPDGTNPTVIRGNKTVTFRFLVSSSASTPLARSKTISSVSITNTRLHDLCSAAYIKLRPPLSA